MLSDDVYRARRALTIAELSAWTGFVADVASVEYGSIDGAWRIAMTPRCSTACPVELLLRDDQKFDLRIGSETYEDRPIESLDAFLPLLQAIADGRVVTRRTLSALTGLLRETETFVYVAPSNTFHGRLGSPDGRSLPPPLPGEANGLEIRELHYVPYRR